MNITNEVVTGMTPQEKEIFFKHMEKRHREEAEKLRLERERLQTYKQGLIEDILKDSPNYPIDQLKKLTIRSLERILYQI